MSLRLSLLLWLLLSGCTEVIPHDLEDAGTVSFVQYGCADPNNVSSASLTLPNASTAGALLVAAVDFASTGQDIVSVTDSQGHSWQPVFPLIRSGTGASQTWFTSSTGGPLTVSVALDGSSNGIDLFVHEYSSDGAPLTLAASSSATELDGETTLRTGTASVPLAGDLLFAHASGASTIKSVGASLLTRGRCGSNMTADGLASAAGAHEVTFEAEARGQWTATLTVFTRARTTPRNLTVGCSSVGAQAPWLIALALTCLRRTRRRGARPGPSSPSPPPTPRRSE